jgi:general secretion pathway protein J
MSDTAVSKSARRSSPGNARGFTLIEVLVALVLTGLVAVLAYGALSSTIVASESTEREAQRLQALAKTFRLLERDLGFIVKRPATNNYGEPLAVLGVGEEGALLSFTRGGWPNARDQLRSDLQRVRYRWENQKLWRDYWFHTDRSPVDEAVSVVLMDGVQEVRLRFLNSVGVADNSEHGQWRQTWLVRDAGDRLPAAVEVVFVVEVVGEVRRLLVLPANG